MSSDPVKRPRHNLSSESLDQLKESGDPEAYGVLQDRAIVKDYVTNPATRFREPVVHLGTSFWIQFKKDTDGRVKVWVQTDEMTTIDTIKKHWGEIRQWQKFLREWQEPPKLGKEGFIRSLFLKQKNGASYAELVEHVANRAFVWLEWYRRQETENFEESLKRIDDWSEAETQHWASECSAALQVFELLGAKDNASIHAWWIDALKHIQSNGRRPIEMDVPITRQNMIDTLKAYRKQHKERV